MAYKRSSVLGRVSAVCSVGGSSLKPRALPLAYPQGSCMGHRLSRLSVSLLFLPSLTLKHLEGAGGRIDYILKIDKVIVHI
jgi:hypothetical protein